MDSREIDTTPPRPDSDPFYVRQTGEPEHLADTESMIRWLHAARDEAAQEGNVGWVRVTSCKSPRALLIEIWHERPAKEGPARWAFTAKENSHEQ